MWQLFMVGLLPLFALQMVHDKPTHKLRAWAAMFCASLLAQYVTPAVGDVPVRWYIGIDFIAGALVLARPAGVAQKAVGGLFAIMIMSHIGFALAGPNAEREAYYATQNFAGWMQFSILALWGGIDSGRACYNRFWPASPRLNAKAVKGASRK